MLDEDRHGVFISDGMMTQATDGHGPPQKEIHRQFTGCSPPVLENMSVIALVDYPMIPPLFNRSLFPGHKYGGLFTGSPPFPVVNNPAERFCEQPG